MEHPLEIQARGETSPPPIRGAGRPAPGLPPDLLEQSARRLGTACLVWVGLWSLALLMNNVVVRVVSPDAPLDDAWPWPGNPVAIAVIVLSFLVFGYTHRRRVKGIRALDVGLAY